MTDHDAKQATHVTNMRRIATSCPYALCANPSKGVEAIEPAATIARCGRRSSRAVRAASASPSRASLTRRGGWQLVLAARREEPLAAAAAELARDRRALRRDRRRRRRGARRRGRRRGRLRPARARGRRAGARGRAGRRSRAPTARSFEVNYIGLVRVATAFWPLLEASRGRLVPVVSVAGTVALAPSAPYASAKSAALSWARSYGAAAREHGVAVTIVNPGPVPTPGFPQGRSCAAAGAPDRGRRRALRRAPAGGRRPPRARGLRAAVVARRRGVAGRGARRSRRASRRAPGARDPRRDARGRARVSKPVALDHRRQLRHRPRHRAPAARARLPGRAQRARPGSARSARRGARRDRRRGRRRRPRKAARRIVAEVRRLGRLDWLVNNAGTGGGTAGLDVDVERARRVLETNFYSHVALTHELWPLLRESPRARVIVVSSSLGTYSSSGSITYGASKAALTSWGRALAVAARRAGHRGHARQSGPGRDDDASRTTSCWRTAGSASS